ncbi:MAG: hypothetical protein H6507_07310 [Calditrichaeota bacterium]|nr:hypothetical protein [Calditrichota bacterium]
MTNARYARENEVKIGFVLQTAAPHETRSFADKVRKYKNRVANSAQFLSHAHLFNLTQS